VKDEGVTLEKAVASIKELQTSILKHGIMVSCSDATIFT
jgi:hypothetical protein